MQTPPRPEGETLLDTRVLIALSLQLGAAVAVPTVLLALGGHWLDERFGTTDNRWLFAGLALALVLSIAFIYRIAKGAQERISGS